MSVITIERKILERNEQLGQQNREWLARHGIRALNLLSSPGSGKTTLIEKTLERLGGRMKIAVIEGDVHTSLDAERVDRYGVPVAQIVTQGGCHLEARLVQQAMDKLDLTGTQLLLIENVGNLVCPANYDLGENLKVIVLSTTEGEDKPLKYAGMFRNASLLLISKMDLLPYLHFDLAALRRNALQINPALRVFEVAATTGQGMEAWCGWLEEFVAGRP
jgi:hydrogenase nickel incorporation protein HypB